MAINPKGKAFLSTAQPEDDSFVLYSTFDTERSNWQPDPDSESAKKARQARMDADNELARAHSLANSVLDEVNRVYRVRHPAQSYPTLMRDTGVFKSVQAGSFFNNSPQRAIQDMLNLKEGQHLVGFDLETLGTASFNRRSGDLMKTSAITEMAFVHMRMGRNGEMSRVGNRALSLLVRPGQDAIEEIGGLVNTLKANRGRMNLALSSDQRRTLSDLILYSDASKLRRHDLGGGKFFTEVLGQVARPTTDTVLTQGTVVDQIVSGWNNLLNLGTDASTAAMRMNDFLNQTENLSQGSGYKLVGHNIRAFDQPFMREWMGKHAANDSNVANALMRLERDTRSSIDVLHAYNTVHKSIVGLRNNSGNVLSSSRLGALANFYGIASGTSHFGLDDAETVTRVLGVTWNEFQASQGSSTAASGLVTPLKFNQRTLKLNDRLFSISGVQSFEMGKYDAVYRLGADGKFAPAYGDPTFRGNPVYRDSSYRLTRFYKDVHIDGKTRAAMMLHNTTENTYHWIVRDTEEGLQNLIHENFLDRDPNDRASRGLVASSRRDKAMRRYLKMFDSDVTMVQRMHRALDEYQNAKAQGMSEKQIARHIRNTVGVSAEEYRDFRTMIGNDPANSRLALERSFVAEAAETIARTMPNDRRGQAMAMSSIKRQMDAQFGENISTENVNNRYRSIFRLDIDGREHHIQVTQNPDLIRSGLSSAISSGHVGGIGQDSKISIGLIKQRLISVTDQLRKAGALNQAEVEAVLHDIDKLSSDDRSINQRLTFISNKLQDAQRTAIAEKRVFGLATMDLEDPTWVTPNRMRAMREGLSDRKDSMITKALDDVYALHTKSFVNGKLNFNLPDHKYLTDIINQHEGAIDKIIASSGLDNIDKGIARRDTLVQGLQRALDAFSGPDTDSHILYNAKTKGLVLAVTAKKDTARIFKMSPNEILEMKTGAALLVDLPKFDGRGNIYMPGTGIDRVGRIKIAQQYDGSFKVKTAFDEAIDNIVRYSKYGKESLMQDVGRAEAIMSARKSINRASREVLLNLSINRTGMNVSDMDKNLSTSKSNLANFNRARAVDVSDMAQDWYYSYFIQGKRGKTNRDYEQAYRKKVATIERDKSKSFFELLNQEESREFHRNIEFYARDRYNINLDSHSIRDTAVAQGLRGASAGDARHFFNFGMFNPNAREAFFKVLNYLPPEGKEEVAERMKQAGYSDADVNRKLYGGLATDKMLAEADGQIGFIGTRAAYMSNAQVASALEKAGINSPFLGTHEGLMIMSRQTASTLDRVRERRIQLSESSILDSKISRAISDVLGGFDPEQVMSEEQMTKLRAANINLVDLMGRIESGQDMHKVTVGVLVKDGVKGGGAFVQDFYSDRENQVFIRGWDADRRQLILEQRQDIKNGSKVLSSSGHRLSALVMEDAEFRKAFPGVEAILPQAEEGLSKGNVGAHIDEVVNLYIDEANRKITAGTLQQSEVLNNLEGLIKKNFSMERGDIWQKDGRLVMRHDFGQGVRLGPQNVKSFMREADQLLGTNYLTSDVVQGVVGLAQGDVYNWTKSVGFTAAHGGLVNYTVKEMEMVQYRMERALGGRSVAFENFMNRYMDRAQKVKNVNGEMVAQKGARVNPYHYTEGLYQSLMTPVDKALQGGTIRENEIVIRTRGASDGSGFTRAEIDEGIKGKVIGGALHIDAKAFNDLPEMTQYGQKFTVKDYQHSLLDARNMSIAGPDNSVLGIGDWMERSKGTMLFELPDDTFGQRYVRFVDTNSMPRGKNLGDSQVIRELDQAQMQIWRAAKEYQRFSGQDGKLAEDAHARLQKALTSHDDLIAKTISSARDGSLSKTVMSASLDMSGQFIIQGVNPMSAAGKGMQEGTLYVSRQRVGEMIQGAEDRILGILDKDTYTSYFDQWQSQGGKKKVGSFSSFIRNNEAMYTKVMDVVEREGLYGLVNRFPTITEDTIQVMKVKIDPRLAGDDTAKITVGTSMKLRADYDGDFLSAVLAHYGDNKYAMKLHQDYKRVWEKDIVELNRFRDEVVNPRLQEEFAGSYDEMWAEGGKMSRKMSEWYARTTESDMMESNRARVGKQIIGVIDNKRQMLLNLSDTTYNILAGSNKITVQDLVNSRAKMMQFGEIMSQNLISSKKFDTQTLRQEFLASNPNASQADIDAHVSRQLDIQNRALVMLEEGLAKPDFLGLDNIREANRHLGVFQDDAAVSRNRLEMDTKGKQTFTLDEMMDELRRIYELNGRATGVWLDNESLKIGLSEGKSADSLREMYMGNGDMVVSTPHTRAHAEYDPGFSNRLASDAEKHKRLVLANIYNMSPGDNMADIMPEMSTRLSNEMLSGATVAEEASVKFGSVVRQFAGNLGGPMISGGAIKAGAAIFGGLWAASALMRGGPTPESTANPEGSEGAPRGSAMGILNEGPTARIQRQGNAENINISISAKDARGMSPSEISAMVNEQLNAMMNTNVSFNMNVTDNSQEINQQWLQGVVANALNKGFAF